VPRLIHASKLDGLKLVTWSLIHIYTHTHTHTHTHIHTESVLLNRSEATERMNFMSAHVQLHHILDHMPSGLIKFPSEHNMGFEVQSEPYKG